VRTNGVIDHLWIRVADVQAARAFYATIAPYAGLREGHDEPGLAQFRSEGGSFCLVAGTPTEHLHMAFTAGDHAAVDAFHRAATQAGHRDGGAPGERPENHPGYYGAYVLDPDAHSIEVVDHGRS
jgi:catechol 2,3-dioxygenase-like lactoylglutathione lyase family enzyme